ncbi:MAG: Holliday junction resolvase RuvX [Epsilonproteobacteria bacterium]|nr:Holliday junction resolvase RuvX [Campylobacterota bacterium]NPA56120.1 Holliday junction resolvase RuvX [Campylobacterota bacterium]
MESRVAGVDVGLKRIGVALLLGGVPIPQNPIIRRNRDQAARDLSRFLKEWEVERLVVGIPEGGKSQEEMERRIRHFVGLLDFDGEVEYIDESFTSREARESTKGVFRHRRDGRLDSIAAQKILERWLLARRTSPSASPRDS